MVSNSDRQPLAGNQADKSVSNWVILDSLNPTFQPKLWNKVCSMMTMNGRFGMSGFPGPVLVRLLPFFMNFWFRPSQISTKFDSHKIQTFCLGSLLVPKQLPISWKTSNLYHFVRVKNLSALVGVNWNMVIYRNRSGRLIEAGSFFFLHGIFEQAKVYSKSWGI